MARTILKGTKFTWVIELLDNPLTKDDLTDKRAIVRKTEATKTPKDAAKRVIGDGAEFREETLLLGNTLMNQQVMQFLLSGQSYSDGFFRYEPVLKGAFDEDGQPKDPSNLKFTVNVYPEGEMAEHLEKDVLYDVWRNQENGGAQMVSVLDQLTELNDGTVKRGNPILIKGNKIKLVNAEGENKKGKIFLYNESEEETPVTQIITSEPSSFSFILPNDLAEGAYRLEIETYFAGANVLTNPRRLVFPRALNVV